MTDRDEYGPPTWALVMAIPFAVPMWIAMTPLVMALRWMDRGLERDEAIPVARVRRRARPAREVAAEIGAEPGEGHLDVITERRMGPDG